MKRARQQEGKTTLELVEEAAHLLRRAPASCLAAYCLGSVPFIMGLLFFWADMSRSAFATYHTAEAALGMAFLFFWMKTWQAIFARRLRAVLSSHEPRPLRAGEMFRLAVSQAVIHALGLFVVPLSLIAVIPFGWVFAFCQSATALADDGLEGLPKFSAKLVRHSTLWPQQNHALVLVLFGFGLVVFLNWTSVCLALPFLAKTLFGVESVYSRSVFSLLNTTFFAAMFGLTYLVVDPLIKAVYLLRCFYGDSLKTGEDVRGELKHLAALAQRTAGQVAVVLMCALVLGASANPERIESRNRKVVGDTKAPGEGEPSARSIWPGASGGGPRRSAPVPGRSNFGRAVGADVSSGFGLFGLLRPGTGALRNRSFPTGFQAAESLPPEDLSKAIEDTIKKRKYAWRMPRDKAQQKSAEQSMLSRFFEKVGDMLQRALKAFGRWLDNLLRNLFQGRTPSGPSSFNWVGKLQGLAYLLIAAVVGAALWLLFRYWRSGRLPLKSVSSMPIEPAPDLTDENVGADQLPEDGWLRLGRELLEQGEFRLALRAYYLASLAHLAERNLVSLAKFKSNRDYQRELQRRAQAFPEVASVFEENVGVFDRVWYGRHEVNAFLVAQFATNVERLKGVPA